MIKNMKKVIYVLCNYRCLYKIEINQLERKSVQKKLETLLERINNDYRESIVSKFTITPGDEFQGLLSALSLLIVIIELITKELYPHLVRFGVGISDIYTKIDPDKAIGAI